MVATAGCHPGASPSDDGPHQDTRTLDGISHPSAAIDRTGRITAVNEAWVDVSLEAGASLTATGPGANYLDVCARAGGVDAPVAAEVRSGLQAVLAGALPSFTVDYPVGDGWGAVRWWMVRATATTTGAVLTHVDITDLKMAEDRLQVDPAAAVATDPGAVAGIYDERGRLVEISPGAVGVLQLPTSRQEGASLADFLSGGDLDRAQALLARLVAEPGRREVLRVRVRDGAGRTRVFDYTAERIDTSGPVRVAVTGAEVTLQERRRISRHLEGDLVQQFPTAVAVTDDDGVLMVWNHQAEALTGLRGDDVLGRRLTELGVLTDDDVGMVLGAAKGAGRWVGDLHGQRPDGAALDLHLVLDRIDDERLGFHGFAASAIDIRERRLLEERLAWQAEHDELTGLANRRSTVDHLRAALAAGGEVAVVLLDVDDFSMVNDALGHKAGDDVLRSVGDLLSAVVGADACVGRPGGDEFVIVSPVREGVPEAIDLVRLAQTVCAVPFRSGNQELTVSLTAGVAVGSEAGDELLRNADVALYTAKGRGRGQLEVYDDRERRRRRRTRALASELDVALSDGDVRAWFQPVVDLRAGALTGFEALARWHHPERGVISPAEFVPIAEESGLIDRLGIRMLDQACEAAAAWAQRGLTIAVNVSPYQFVAAGFADRVADMLAAHHVPPGALAVEVTESTLAPQATAIDVLHGLRSLGVRVALDDFGTGFSSLNRLRYLPLDQLKVDRSFITDLADDDGSRVIVETIVGLAHALDLEVVAEGVEHRSQLEVLASTGCRLAQGFLWSGPVDADHAARLARGPRVL